MIIDKNLELSTAQAITTDDTATASENVVDLTQTTLRSPGEGIWIIGRVIQAVDSAADGASVKFQLVTSAAAALSTPTVHYDTGYIAEATLVAGYEIFKWRVPDTLALRYLGILTTATGEDLTAGTFDFFMTTEAPIPAIK